MTTLLRRSEIEKLLDLRQAMEVLKQTYEGQSEGKVDQVPPLRFMNRGMRLAVGGLPSRWANWRRLGKHALKLIIVE